MFVFDSHAHIIPPLRKASGYKSIDEHLRVCQRAMHEHLAQPARREIDNEIVKKRLWDEEDPSPKGMCNVNFKVGSCGRFTWTQDEVPCYIQYLPPYVENMEVSPRMLKTMMDYAGVNAAVLQCGGAYGKLNSYYEKVMRDNVLAQNVFFPLARIEEGKAYTRSVQNELVALFASKYLKGLWFAARPEHFSSRFDTFWQLVKQLAIPVFLLFFPDENWIHQFRGLDRWAGLFKDIPCVLAQAFPLPAHKHDATLSIPDYTKAIINECNFLIEIVYPIGRGAVEDYPYTVSRRAVQSLYHAFGAKKLVWGSDIPMVERYCTYNQSLRYLVDYCEFIPPADLELIIGGNLKKLFF